MRIEKLELYKFGEDISIAALSQRFEIWFQEHIEPINKMLDSGVEVQGSSNPSTSFYSFGYGAKAIRALPEFDTHKALLINIQPIKKETAEDVLSWLIEYSHPSAYDTIFGEGQYKRAKAVLGQE